MDSRVDPGQMSGRDPRADGAPGPRPVGEHEGPVVARGTKAEAGTLDGEDDRDPTAIVDLHNHLVPGVDDGARDLDAVRASVERMTRVGIRKIVTTPHIDASSTLDRGMLRRRLDEVSRAWQLAEEALARDFPEVQYRRGHEVMLDVPDPDLSDERMRLAGTDYVLIEWPRMRVPPGTRAVLARLVERGLRPVVAHPERYVGVGSDLDVIEQWRDAGALLQVNYGSFVGRYGSEARTVAFRLVRRGWIDLLSTDFHGQASMKLYKTEAWRLLEDLGAGDRMTMMCVTNGARLLRNEPTLPVAPLKGGRGFWSRLRELLGSEGRERNVR